jgi:hypothetical protein
MSAINSLFICGSLSSFGIARTSSRRRESLALARKSIKPWNDRDFGPKAQHDARRSTDYFVGAGVIAGAAGAVALVLDFFFFLLGFDFLVAVGVVVSADFAGAVAVGAAAGVAGVAAIGAAGWVGAAGAGACA